MKRFYKDVAVEKVADGWHITLDGRPIRTQMGNPQVVPTSILAGVMQQEWADQGDRIDPKAFLFRDHADFAIDVVRPDREAAIAKLLSFAQTDTLCYRADPEDALYREQLDRWEPLLEHLEAKHAIRYQRISGVMHRPQPDDTIATLQSHLATLDDFHLAGLSAMASLSASLAIALLANDEAINDPMLLWRDANLEEDWQAEHWGNDPEAQAVRDKRAEDFSAAQVFTMLALTRD
ncbi:ATP12 family chaperone protein [Qipengyuania oceanensis]|uniref:Molecular chaperone n=1 Tax=Qipengyuania oceanensis TaxID=1463597 RepID=A0A844YEU4_9SPHN|nr:ATP12 family protein [Qipengyuania oceanensis]MXO62462.1 molecular chaperone [Qipengyuania oceanensis]